MPKLFSKIIIALLLTVAIWGGGKVAYAADCSQLTGNGLANCEIYNRNNDGSNPASIKIQTSTGEETEVFPDGRAIVFRPDGTRESKFPDGSRATYNPATGEYINISATGEQTVTNIGASAPSDASFMTAWGNNAPTGKDWWNGIKSLGDIVAGIYNFPEFAVMAGWLSLIYGLLSMILALGAALLDQSIRVSIGGFSDFVKTVNIVDSWVIIRDIINISFIFIILYIAITTIIGGIGVKTKVQLKDVVIGAILINFSMFFTKIIIDAGNIIAMVLANKIYAMSNGAMGLTGIIMNALKFQSLLKLSTFVKVTGQANAIFQLVFSLILVGAAAWAFIYAAILFLFRNITLLFLMAISPIGFIGGTLPWFKDKASEWWSTLIEQVVVAPYFLFMLFIIIKIINGIKAASTLGGVGNQIVDDLKNFYNGESAFDYAMFINAFLIIGALFIAIKTTKKLAGKTNDLIKVAAVAVGAGIAVKMASAANAAEGMGRFRGASQAVTDFASGKLNDRPGLTGAASRYARNGIMSSVKELSGSVIDPKKIEADYKRYNKENTERLMKAMEAVGPQKAMDERKQLNDTKNNINSQFKESDPDLYKKGTEAKEEIDRLRKDVKAAEKEMNEAKNDAAKQAAKEKMETAQIVLDLAKDENKDIVDNFNGAQERVAASMGTSMTKIESGLEKAERNIEIGQKKKNAYINKVEGKSGLLGAVTGIIKTGKMPDERRELAAKMRAHQGKYTPKSKRDEYLEEVEAKIKKDLESGKTDDKEKKEAKTEPKATEK
jgi:hypothetical protein